MDWKAIKKEYVTTDTSYQKLADKYGISKGQLGKVASKEKWVEAKEQYDNDTFTKSLKKAQKNEIDYKSSLYKLAFKVANQLNEMTDNLTVEQWAAMGIKPRDITGAIKDLEDALHVKSEKDIEEQEARINKLKKDSEISTDGQYGVILLPPIETIQPPSPDRKDENNE